VWRDSLCVQARRRQCLSTSRTCPRKCTVRWNTLCPISTPSEYASRRTYEYVMSMCLVAYVNVSCQAYDCLQKKNCTCMNTLYPISTPLDYASRRTYEYVMAMCLIARMNVSCLCVSSHICMCHVTFVHVWTRCILLLRRVGMRLVVCTNISCMHKNASTKIFEHVSTRCVLLLRRVSTRHDAIHMNVSCHAHECVMSYI